MTMSCSQLSMARAAIWRWCANRRVLVLSEVLLKVFKEHQFHSLDANVLAQLPPIDSCAAHLRGSCSNSASSFAYQLFIRIAL